MPNATVKSIFIRQLTDNDFWHIERGPATDRGGGSQTYIDIPLDGTKLLEPLWRFLNVPSPHDPDAPWPTARITVKTVGMPERQSEIEFGPRESNNRYRITNQARQKVNQRPHAWTAANGFPQAPDDIASKTDPRIPDVSTVKIYVVKTVDDNYYAGFVNQPAMPADWPRGLGLEKLFDRGVSSDVLFFEEATAPDVPDLVRRILNAWSQGERNVLLYGPPGTGKTHAMQRLWSLLATGSAPLRELQINPDDVASPFSAAGVEVPLAQPIRREWVTFHQNYSYEDFIVGLRPVSSAAGTLSLKPRVGKLLDLAISLDKSINQPHASQFASGLLYIDEINRGNVSRIFGEFITFMEPVYRAGSDIPLPVPLPSIGSDPANSQQTEGLERVGLQDVNLPRPWFFPSDLFVLASMNSVDRAVAPLDSALARRFARIEVPPDMGFLAGYLGIADTSALIQLATRNTVSSPGEQTGEGEEQEESIESETDATASEVAWLLLYRLNYEIAVTLGCDFELGHAYVMGVANKESEDEKFKILARAWDQSIYPQLQERFINRPDELLRILRLDKPPEGYLFSKRLRPGISARPSRVRDIPVIVSLEESSTNQLSEVKLTLRHLAGLT